MLLTPAFPAIGWVGVHHERCRPRRGPGPGPPLAPQVGRRVCPEFGLLFPSSHFVWSLYCLCFTWCVLFVFVFFESSDVQTVPSFVYNRLVFDSGGLLTLGRRCSRTFDWFNGALCFLGPKGIQMDHGEARARAH